jgi:acid phosphatase family membrane protein YuiD
MAISEIITNEVLIIPIVSWFITQLVKMIIELLKGNGLDFRYLVSSGGMPSSHSAIVSALATAVGMIHGFDSTVFGITVVLALIVMYDAAGVRQSVSKQSIVLNDIVRELRDKHPHLDRLKADLRELIGHTPFQVIIGSAIGVIVAWLWISITGT